jgi:riboflavin kinase/FMN adenylyltransferase
MKIVNDTKDLHLSTPSIVTLGKFDGFHLGHQSLFEKMLALKEETGFPVVVFTFEVSPNAKLKGYKPQFVLSNEEREGWLSKRGVDYLIKYPFTDSVRNMEAEDFIREILFNDLKAAHIVMGEDFHFGHNRKGNFALLDSKKEEFHYNLWVMSEVIDNGEVISSTRIRKALSEGKIEEVNRLLGHSYYVEGIISHGAQLGRTIDMPTINILPDEIKLLPPFGVYATKVEIEGKWYDGVTNIGRKPTVGDHNARGVETYLLHTTGDFYGKKACVYLQHFQRPEKKFDSIDELKQQMHQDAINAEKYLAKKEQ